jgi:hypothetical protein
MVLFTDSKLSGKLSAAPRLMQVGISHVQVQKQVPGLNPELGTASYNNQRKTFLQTLKCCSIDLHIASH